MYDELYDVYEKLCCELCDYGQKELTQDTLKTIDTLAHAAKNVLKVMQKEEGSSYAYYDEDPRNTAMRRSHRMSHKRDSMGRYSRDGGSEEMSNRMSRNGGNNVTDGLRELMYAAPPEMQGEINRLIKKLDNM